MPAHEMCDRRTRGSLDQQIAIFEHIASLVMLSVANATFPLSTLKKCIKVAQRLLALRNYNHLAAVVTGLNSARVQNLKSVWADLPGSLVADAPILLFVVTFAQRVTWSTLRSMR